MGIVSGIGNDKFNPNGKITRQEAARMLYTAATISQWNPDFEKYFDWKFIENNKYIDFPHSFTDVKETDYYKKTDTVDVTNSDYPIIVGIG